MNPFYMLTPSWSDTEWPQETKIIPHTIGHLRSIVEGKDIDTA